MTSRDILPEKEESKKKTYGLLEEEIGADRDDTGLDGNDSFSNQQPRKQQTAAARCALTDGKERENEECSSRGCTAGRRGLCRSSDDVSLDVKKRRSTMAGSNGEDSYRSGGGSGELEREVTRLRGWPRTEGSREEMKKAEAAVDF